MKLFDFGITSHAFHNAEQASKWVLSGVAHEDKAYWNKRVTVMYCRWMEMHEPIAWRAVRSSATRSYASTIHQPLSPLRVDT